MAGGRCVELGPDLVRSWVTSDESAVRACMRFAGDHRVLVEPACGAALAECLVIEIRWVELPRNGSVGWAVLGRWPTAAECPRHIWPVMCPVEISRYCFGPALLSLRYMRGVKHLLASIVSAFFLRLDFSPFLQKQSRIISPCSRQSSSVLATELQCAFFKPHGPSKILHSASFSWQHCPAAS